MSRRETSVRLRCGHPGCTEYGFYSCSTRADAADLQRRYHPDRWRCVRHTRPDEVLSPDNTVRTEVMTVLPLPHGNYWAKDTPGSRFIFGPGFKAYACDFPAGTRIRVTAEILPPEATE